MSIIARGRGGVFIIFFWHLFRYFFRRGYRFDFLPPSLVLLSVVSFSFVALFYLARTDGVGGVAGVGVAIAVATSFNGL